MHINYNSQKSTPKIERLKAIYGCCPRFHARSFSRMLVMDLRCCLVHVNLFLFRFTPISMVVFKVGTLCPRFLLVHSTRPWWDHRPTYDRADADAE